MRKRQRKKRSRRQKKSAHFEKQSHVPLPRGCHEYIRDSQIGLELQRINFLFIVLGSVHDILHILKEERKNIVFSQEEDEEDGPILYRDDDNMEDEGDAWMLLLGCR